MPELMHHMGDYALFRVTRARHERPEPWLVRLSYSLLVLVLPSSFDSRLSTLSSTIWLDATYRPVAPLTAVAMELAAVGLVRLTGNGAVSLVGEVSTHDTTSQIN